MPVLHFSFSGDGGAGRAGRRASIACGLAGLSSTFSYVEGKRQGANDICFQPTDGGTDRGSQTLSRAFKDLQWNFIPARRTSISNVLLSTAYPGIDVADHPAVATSDIVHLHWPTWGITPATIGRWLGDGRHVFWTLHDFWAMTGGCHYPTGCEQYATECLKCPQMQDDLGLISSNFTDKLHQYGSSGHLHIVAPSLWLAREAKRSRILGRCPVSVVRNAVELDVFSPRPDRRELRASFGLSDTDLLLFFSSYDLKEHRKGVLFLRRAVRMLVETGELAAALPPGGRIFLAASGRSSVTARIPGVIELDFGVMDDDEVVADVLCIADLVCVPSLEENYPNVIVEAMACGTPCLCTAVGGVPEMIEDGVTGLLVGEAGSPPALAAGLLRFARGFHRSGAMRCAVRRAVERTNDPMLIGTQLRGLYEAALGRSMPSGPQAHRDRMTRVFAKAPVHRETPTTGDLLRFPTNMALLRQITDTVGLADVTSPRPVSQGGRQQILTVRTYHGHHSARSGPYQYVRHLNREAFEAEHIAVPLGTELVGECAESFRRAGLLMGARSFGQQGNAWLAEAEVLFRCAARPVDLVHFIDGELGGWLLSALPPSLFAGCRRPAMVITLHQPRMVLQGMINADLLKDFDGVIALCRDQRDFLAGYVDQSRIFLVPHGIDTEYFAPQRDRSERAPGPFRVLMVGHWLREVTMALDAFAAVRNSGVDAELTIISPAFPSVEGREGVILRSGVSDEELRQAYWDADVVFVPLKDATANNALLEAMACGRPVVSTDVGGVRECVGDGAGILCPPGDVALHGQALLRLVRAPVLRERMGRAGRARAEELDWRHVARQYEAVYGAILDRNATPERGVPERTPVVAVSSRRTAKARAKTGKPARAR